MKRIQIRKHILGIGFNHNDCVYCGLNTNLLGEDETVVIPEKNEKGNIIGCKKYCRHCYEGGIDKKRAEPSDFYGEFAFRAPSSEEIQQQIDHNRACESKCRDLSGLEVAHLCGERAQTEEMNLDMFLDKAGGEVFFRLTLCDNDDDPWLTTESRDFISIDRAIELLNKNDIHILDGLTAENLEAYFEFVD